MGPHYGNRNTQLVGAQQFYDLLELKYIFCTHTFNLTNTLNQFSSVAHWCLTLCDPMNHSTRPGLHVHHQLSESLKLISIESGLPSSHLILCCPLLLLPPIPSSIRVFYKESTLHMTWPEDWSFSFSISHYNEYPGLISFRMERLNLFTVQGTIKSLLQHQNSKASILQHSPFFRVQLSHPYLTTGKTIALTR